MRVVRGIALRQLSSDVIVEMGEHNITILYEYQEAEVLDVEITKKGGRIQ